MNVAIVNRGFLDYRVPVFEELHGLLGGELYVLCSKDSTPERVTKRLEKTLGKKMIVFENEFVFGERDGVSSDFANRNIRIPYQQGLMRKLKEVNPDIVLAEGFFQWTWMAVLFCIRYKKKLVISYERTAFTERNAQWYRIALRKFVARFVSGYIVNGSLTKEYLKQLGIVGKPVGTGQMVADTGQIENSVKSITDKEKLEMRREYQGDRKGLIYFSAGQLIKRKGYAELLAAWGAYKNNYQNDDLLLIAGKGAEEECLREMIEVQSIEGVQFIGHLSYDAMPIHYAITDVFVMPTLEDNWSLVVPEAMACGLPVITTKFNGCWPELVHVDNGKVVDPYDKEGFASVFYSMKSADLKKMGSKSKLIVKDFTPRTAAGNIFNLCSQVYNDPVTPSVDS